MPTLLFLLAAILVPPVGIVMLWMRKGVGVFKKILGSLAIAGWTVAALMLFFGLHFELDAGVGKPSRWNTLRALRVLRWRDGHALTAN